IAQLVQISRRGAALLNREDNSNTQFASLALWIARRHGLPVKNALARIDARFRSSQDVNGGWGDQYNWSVRRRVTYAIPQTSAAMTCSGLLGLAVAHGAFVKTAKGANRYQAISPNKDRSMRAGLIALASCVGQPVGKNKDNIPRIQGRNNKAYYFLWSLERVAVIYGLSSIGKKDWYRWGAEILLANQENDGSWQGGYPQGGVDTSFALLFLCRSNLAPD